jgi:tight adherence protein B
MNAASLYFYGALAAIGLSFAGIAFVLLRAFTAGAETYSGVYSEKTARKFEDLFLFIPPRRIAEAGWACAGAAFLGISLAAFDPERPLFSLLGAAIGAMAGAAALQLPDQVLALLRTRRRRRFNEQLVDALGHMSNALRAGFSITQSFETVVANGENPIAQEFEVFLQQTRVGIPFSDALVNLDQRVGSEDLELVCAAMDTARRTGGNLTEIFDKISLTIRERMRIERRVLTLTAQGRLQGVIVGSMPLFVVIAMIVVRPGIMLPYLHTAAGLSAMAAVIVLVTLGALIIRKIIRIDV